MKNLDQSSAAGTEKTFAERIIAVMKAVGAVSKDKVNPHFKYPYVSAESLRAKVQAACVANGLVLRIAYSNEHVTPGESFMKCSVSASADGETFVHLGDGWGAGLDKSEKSPMKACTSAAKYALSNAFCIPLGEDPEADGETDEEAERHPSTNGFRKAEPETRQPSQALKDLCEEAQAISSVESAERFFETFGKKIKAMLSSEEREMLWAEVKKIKDAANESIDEYNKTAGDAPKEKRITVELLRNLVTQHVEGRS